MTNYDYWASYSFYDAPHISEKTAVDYLLKDGLNPYPQEIPDLSARMALAALALLGDKEYARAGMRREPGGLIKLYQQPLLHSHLHERLMQYRDLLASAPDLTMLPTGAFVISFNFTLTSPYLSKDDTALHLLDNPVKKEWVFKLPYVASTQWKGALRAAVRQRNDWSNGEPALLHLFGVANDNDDSGEQGRLYFYPTFFDRLSLEVINPHDRETGAGSQPILMECVPSGATGVFTLLYTPLDRIGQDETETRRQVFADLQLVAAGLEALFTVYGFGAKTSNGFGLANGRVGDGRIQTNVPDALQQALPPLEPVMPAALAAFLKEFPNEDFSLKPIDWRKQRGSTSSQRDQYRDARSEFQAFQTAQVSYKEELRQWKEKAQSVVQSFISGTFDDLTALPGVASAVGGKLIAGGAA